MPRPGAETSRYTRVFLVTSRIFNDLCMQTCWNGRRERGAKKKEKRAVTRGCGGRPPLAGGKFATAAIFFFPASIPPRAQWPPAPFTATMIAGCGVAAPWCLADPRRQVVRVPDGFKFAFKVTLNEIPAN